jgi:hypothetical protein
MVEEHTLLFFLLAWVVFTQHANSQVVVATGSSVQKDQYFEYTIDCSIKSTTETIGAGTLSPESPIQFVSGGIKPCVISGLRANPGPRAWIFVPGMGTPELSLLTDCYPASKCPGKCIRGNPHPCVIRLVNLDTMNLVHQVRCHYAEQIHCSPPCSNGHVSENPLLPWKRMVAHSVLFFVQYSRASTAVNPVNGMRQGVPVCVPCAPGTFNTCAIKASCTW